MFRTTEKTPDDVYVNYGHYDGWRHWRDALEYQYVSGCGDRHVQDLKRLEVGNRIWVYLPRIGYVGVAHVIARAQPASTFKAQTPAGPMPILDIIKNPKMAAWHGEHYVAVRWLETVRSLKKAIYAKRPLFSSRLVVCEPKVPEWDKTLAMLRKKFPAYDQ